MRPPNGAISGGSKLRENDWAGAVESGPKDRGGGGGRGRVNGGRDVDDDGCEVEDRLALGGEACVLPDGFHVEDRPDPDGEVHVVWEVGVVWDGGVKDVLEAEVEFVLVGDVDVLASEVWTVLADEVEFVLVGDVDVLATEVRAIPPEEVEFALTDEVDVLATEV